jgi:hypothetical protein
VATLLVLATLLARSAPLPRLTGLLPGLLLAAALLLTALARLWIVLLLLTRILVRVVLLRHVPAPRRFLRPTSQRPAGGVCS